MLPQIIRLCMKIEKKNTSKLYDNQVCNACIWFTNAVTVGYKETAMCDSN